MSSSTRIGHVASGPDDPWLIFNTVAKADDPWITLTPVNPELSKEMYVRFIEVAGHECTVTVMGDPGCMTVAWLTKDEQRLLDDVFPDRDAALAAARVSLETHLIPFTW